MPQRKSSGMSPSMKKSTSASGIFDDLSSMFGGSLLVKFGFSLLNCRFPFGIYIVSF